MVFLKYVNDGFRVGCFSRASDRDITDTDDGNIELFWLEKTQIKQTVPDTYA